MGFFNKITTFANVLTGGGAKVSFSNTPLRVGEPFEITIQVQVNSQDIKISRVYLEIEGLEEVEVHDVDVAYESDGSYYRECETVREKTTTIEQEITIAEGQTLTAEENYEWTVTVELPADALPIYYGRYCRHTYFARASLDCFGNDPDSGWQELN